MVGAFGRSACLAGGIALCLFAAATPARAQQLLVGRVTAPDAVAVAGAQVRLTDAAGRVVAATTTTTDGRYALAGVEPGAYTLHVAADGYLAFDAPVRVRPRQASLPEVVLTARHAADEQVVVIAPPVLEARDYASGQGIDPATLQRLSPARSGSFASAIPVLTASAVTGHDNLVHLRGNELSLQMSINGVSFLDNTHPQFSPAMWPQLFASVELLTGGFAPEFGSRFGGVLDLHTRSGFTSAGRGVIEVGGGGLGRVSGSASWGDHARRWGWLVAATGSRSDRFLNPPQPRTLHDRGSGGQGFVRVDRHDVGSSLSLLLTGGGSHFELPNTPVEQALGRDASKTTTQETAILRWDGSRQDGSLSAAIYQRLARERLNPTTDPETLFAEGKRSDRTWGAKADLTRLLDRHVLKAGLDVKLLRLGERLTLRAPADEHGDGGAPVAAPTPTSARAATAAVPVRSSSGGELDELSFRSAANGSLLSAYLQDEVSFAGGIVVNFGARVDRFELLSARTLVSPRVNVAFDHARWRAHAAYNRMFAPPPIEYLLLSSSTAAPGQPVREVPPMTADHVELGIGRRIGRRLIVELTGFRRSSVNAFETGEIGNTRLFVPVTFAGDEARGLEFALRWRDDPRSRWSADVRYTLSKTEFVGPVTGGFSSEELRPGERIFPAFDQRHGLVAGVRYHARSGFRAALRGRYASGTPTESEHPGAEGRAFERLSSFFLLDLSSGLDLDLGGTRLSLELFLENATDDTQPIAKESEATPVQFGPPRVFSARLRVAF